MGCGANRGQTKETSDPEKKTNQQSDEGPIVRQSVFVQAQMSSVKEEYKIKKNIGEGTYGQVLQVEHKQSGQQRAMKRITIQSLDEAETKKIEQEIIVLKELDHPYILKIFESYMDEQHYYIITQFVKGGELFTEIERRQSFKESQARRVFKELLIVINYSHQLGIMHRDLKPENILLDEQVKDKDSKFNIKVIDWGAAYQFKKNEIVTELIGTPFYIAPQVLQYQYNEKCDIWSLGVILYILLSGEPPFYGDTDKDIFKAIQDPNVKPSFDDPVWNQVTVEAKDIIQKMLNRDYNKRPSANELLNHPWFVKASSNDKEENDEERNKALTRLKGFQTQFTLQKAVLTYIAGHLSSKADTQYLKEMFVKLDKDGNGTLTRQELVEGFKDLKGEDAETFVNSVLQNVDSDQSDAINYTEFLTATIDQQRMMKQEKLNAAFQMFDVDGNGKVSQDQIAFILGNEYSKHEEQWTEIMKKFDINNDGQLDFAEFKNMMSSYADKQ